MGMAGGGRRGMGRGQGVAGRWRRQAGRGEKSEQWGRRRAAAGRKVEEEGGGGRWTWGAVDLLPSFPTSTTLSSPLSILRQTTFSSHVLSRAEFPGSFLPCHSSMAGVACCTRTRISIKHTN